MQKKGVSPIIATILLIAFTLALAGLVASWASSFSTGELQKGTECAGAVELSSLKFSGTVVSLKIRNAGTVALTGLKANIEYVAPELSKTYSNLDMTGTQAPAVGTITTATAVSVAPGSIDFFVYNTSNTARPKSVEIIASNCLKYPVNLPFPHEI
ncbi:MAG: hypothetical protein HY832_00340 [Candidatus Aenigmarchaeota archaeon]|nr:hypothetical protein [Candidatus Aenigmarchaeota archaeon]